MLINMLVVCGMINSSYLFLPPEKRSWGRNVPLKGSPLPPRPQSWHARSCPPDLGFQAQRGTGCLTPSQLFCLGKKNLLPYGLETLIPPYGEGICSLANCGLSHRTVKICQPIWNWQHITHFGKGPWASPHLVPSHPTPSDSSASQERKDTHLSSAFSRQNKAPCLSALVCSGAFPTIPAL